MEVPSESASDQFGGGDEHAHDGEHGRQSADGAVLRIDAGDQPRGEQGIYGAALVFGEAAVEVGLYPHGAECGEPGDEFFVGGGGELTLFERLRNLGGELGRRDHGGV